MQIKNRQQFLIIAAAVGVGLLLVDNMIVDPLVSSWKERREKISKLEDKLAINKRLLAHEGAVIARWDDMRTNMLQGDASAADSQMIQSFDRWSQASGISITAIKPQWKQSEETYAEMECQVDAMGSMERITRFLHEIEKDPIGVKIEAVAVTPQDAGGQQLKLGLQVSGVLLLPKQ